MGFSVSWTRLQILLKLPRPCLSFLNMGMAVLFLRVGLRVKREEAQPREWSAVGAQETSVSADGVVSGVSPGCLA